jgi:hypothetical protein
MIEKSNRSLAISRLAGCFSRSKSVSVEIEIHVVDYQSK